MQEFLIKVTETRTIGLTVQAESKDKAEELARAASANEYEPTEAVTVDDHIGEITNVEFFDRVETE